MQIFCAYDNAKSFEAVRGEWIRATGTDGLHISPLSTKAHVANTFKYVHKPETAVPYSQYDFTIGRDWIPEYVRSGEISAEEAAAGNERPLRTDRKIIWLYGIPCSGKSYKAAQLAESHAPGVQPYRIAAYSGNSKSRWLGPYEGQAVVICDEFRPDQFDQDFLKMMLDRAPQSLTTVSNGKSAMFDPSLLILISNDTQAFVNTFTNNPLWKSRINATFPFLTEVPDEFKPKAVVHHTSPSKIDQFLATKH